MPKDMAASLLWLESIFGPFGEEDHVERSELDALSHRLGAPLPSAFREYYEAAGRAPILQGCGCDLFAPEEIRLQGEHLVYSKARRTDVFWGIHSDHLSMDDPPVALCVPQQDGAWRHHPQFPSVSVAARAMGAWEGVQGTLDFVGVVQLDGADVQFVPPADLGVDLPAMRAWRVIDGVTVLTDGQVFLGARSEDAFLRAAVAIGVGPDAWDYATILDEQ